MRVRAATAFTLLLLAVAVLLLAQTLALGTTARLAPIWVIGPTLALLVFQLTLDLSPRLTTRLAHWQRLPLEDLAQGNTAPTASGSTDELDPSGLISRELRAMLWLLALPGSIYLLGLLPGVGLYLFAYLSITSGEPLWRAFGAASAAVLLLHLALHVLLGTYLPFGALTAWLIR